MNVFGIDLGNYEDTVYSDGRTWKIKHDVTGWTQLKKLLSEDSVIVYEGRCASLEALLGEYDLYSIDPGKSGQIRKSIEESKDDKKDAELLAGLWTIKKKLFKKVDPRSPKLQKLRDMARARRTMVQERTRILQRLQSISSKGKKKDEEWLKGFEKTPYRGMIKVLKTLIREIEMLEKDMESYGSGIESYNILRSIKGMGSKLSAEILAEMDGFESFENESQARKYGGTAPVTISSGTKKVVYSRKRCNHRARNALYLFAFCSLRFHPWARNYYDACRARGKWHSSALISLANRWVPILYSMVKYNTPYNPLRKELRYT